jgi:FeS assembly SUF system protein
MTMDENQMNENQEATESTTEQTASDAVQSTGLSPAGQIRDRIIAVLKTVYDPEIPVDIYELGLIYGVDVTDDGEVAVTMTLTTPMCPVAETLPPEVENKVRNVLGVTDVTLDLVWDPPWSMDMISDAARLELNLM